MPKNRIPLLPWSLDVPTAGLSVLVAGHYPEYVGALYDQLAELQNEADISENASMVCKVVLQGCQRKVLRSSAGEITLSVCPD